jgi:hypothetical protein
MSRIIIEVYLAVLPACACACACAAWAEREGGFSLR